MAQNQVQTQQDDDEDDKPRGGGYLTEIFSPETARTIRRAAPFVALAAIVLLVLRN